MDSSGRVCANHHRSGPTIVAIGFDFDHTLGVDNKLERVAFLRLLEPIADAGGLVIGTLADEAARIDDLLAEQRSGAFTIEDAVRRFARQHGVIEAENLVRRYLQMAPEMVDEFVVPMPGVRRTLAALGSSGVRLAILSNGWNPLQQRKAARVGFNGPVIVSAEIGAQKPDRRAFEALLDVLESPAEQTWYVGDDPRSDVAGAAAAGLRSVWLDAEGRDYPSDCTNPDITINALDELLALAPGLAERS